MLAVNDENKISWKSYYEKLLSRFLWDRNSLSEANIISGVPHLVDKDITRESVYKMKNGKAAGQSGLVLEIVKSVEEAGLSLITISDYSRKGYFSRMET